MAITRYVIVIITCDEPGCGEYYEGLPDDRLTEVKRVARLVGWATGSSGGRPISDRCPTHAKGTA